MTISQLIWYCKLENIKIKGWTEVVTRLYLQAGRAAQGYAGGTRRRLLPLVANLN
jgi:hypothetical protein